MADKNKGKKKKKKKSAVKPIPSPPSYDFANIVQVICPNCGNSTMINTNIVGLKSCYYCNSALVLPKKKKENEDDNEGEDEDY